MVVVYFNDDEDVEFFCLERYFEDFSYIWYCFVFSFKVILFDNVFGVVLNVLIEVLVLN